jgi:hypothetical protein
VSIGIAVNDVDIRHPEQIEDLFFALISKWIWLPGSSRRLGAALLRSSSSTRSSRLAAARVAIDADRAAGPATEGPRSRHRMFSMQRWMAGGRTGGGPSSGSTTWRGRRGLILLLPPIPMAIIVLVAQDSAPL